MFAPAFIGLFDSGDADSRETVTFNFSPAFGFEGCNQDARLTVIDCKVDAIWTWMILNLMRWSKPRFGMMRKRLASWCADSIRLSRKWSARIDRDELVKRIFAK
jgi:hypothetical protein